tara:strand:+ start:73980 stop:74216 length:237 start_codon:yes stop_codon:yes gene_type:complete
MFGDICCEVDKKSEGHHGQDNTSRFLFRILQEYDNKKENKKRNPRRNIGYCSPKKVIIFNTKVVQINKSIPVPLKDFL